MSILKKTKSAFLIQKMWDHENAHLAKFKEPLIRYQVKPTILIPVWKLSWFTMACTVAVEALVTKNYDDQGGEMIANNPALVQDLIEIIKQFRDDEQSHHDIGLQH